MKLKELLKMVSCDYEIGLADFNKYIRTISYGTKENAIYDFAVKDKMTYGQVEDMKVVAIHPVAVAHISDGVELFGDDEAELHVKTRLLIEVQTRAGKEMTKEHCDGKRKD